MIKERLRKEVENNVTLSLKPSSNPEAIDVQGRGELQIGFFFKKKKFISIIIIYYDFY
jgi:predicted membrane GTPase involved in stress response